MKLIFNSNSATFQVEGDGRLVPATDDEVMEAEFLDGNSSVHHVLDNGETGVCTLDDGVFDEEFMPIDCEGLSNLFFFIIYYLCLSYAGVS